MIKILVADDQPALRAALRLLLEQGGHALVVGEAANAGELLAPPCRPDPDTILLDWELPGLSPAGGLASVRRAFPTAQIVALSSQPEARRAALHAGADGFVSKGEPPERLLAALQPRKERGT
jgi:DNA-binding NarL/FixJ family response regulator